MEKIDELYIEVSAKAGKLESELKRLHGKVGKEAKSMGQSFKSSFSKIATGVGIMVAVRKALDISKEAKNLARDAEEIRSKFDTVYSSISAGANRAADDFATSFKLAGSTARELLGNTGDLLVGFGFAEDQALDLSTRVNSLAQDLASFTNYSGGASGASQALTKALLGETESAKSLGIVIRQTDKDFIKQVETLQKTQGYTAQQAKAMVILEQAYKQSGKAVGDFARTQDSLANQERIAEEQHKKTLEILGKGLLPVYRALTKAGAGWAIILQKIMGIEEKAAGSSARVTAYKESLKNLSKEQLESERKILAVQWEQNDAALKEEGAKWTLLGRETERYKMLKLQKQVIEEQAQAFSELNIVTNKTKVSQIVTLKMLREQLLALQDKKELLSKDDLSGIEKANKDIKELTDKIEKLDKLGSGTGGAMDALKTKLEELQKLDPVNQEGWNKLIKKIQDVQDEMDTLTIGDPFLNPDQQLADLDEMFNEQGGRDISDSMDDQIERQKKQQQAREDLPQLYDELRNQLVGGLGEVSSIISDMLGGAESSAGRILQGFNRVVSTVNQIYNLFMSIKATFDAINSAKSLIEIAGSFLLPGVGSSISSVGSSGATNIPSVAMPSLSTISMPSSGSNQTAAYVAKSVKLIDGMSNNLMNFMAKQKEPVIIFQDNGEYVKRVVTPTQTMLSRTNKTGEIHNL